MLTLRPLGSDEHPQSPRGIQLTNMSLRKFERKMTYRTAVLAAALEGNSPDNVTQSAPGQPVPDHYNLPSKMWRKKYASFVSGVFSGHLSARLEKDSSDTAEAA